MRNRIHTNKRTRNNPGHKIAKEADVPLLQYYSTTWKIAKHKNPFSFFSTLGIILDFWNLRKDGTILWSMMFPSISTTVVRITYAEHCSFSCIFSCHVRRDDCLLCTSTRKRRRWTTFTVHRVRTSKLLTVSCWRFSAMESQRKFQELGMVGSHCRNWHILRQHIRRLLTFRIYIRTDCGLSIMIQVKRNGRRSHFRTLCDKVCVLLLFFVLLIEFGQGALGMAV